jgi:hypothetical protein
MRRYSSVGLLVFVFSLAAFGAEPDNQIQFLRFKDTDRIELEESQGLIEVNGAFTVEAWVRWEIDSTEKPQYLMGDEAWPEMSPELRAKRNCGWVLRTTGLEDGKKRSLDFTIGVSFNGKSEWLRVLSPPQRCAEKAWQHVAICKSTERIELFWNGKLVGKKACRGLKFHEAPTNLYLGVRDHAFADRSFGGDFRAFRISSKVRYHNDFKPVKSFEKDKTTTLLLDFAAAEKDKIPDISGNNHHGRISGAMAKSEETSK